MQRRRGGQKGDIALAVALQHILKYTRTLSLYEHASLYVSFIHLCLKTNKIINQLTHFEESVAYGLESLPPGIVRELLRTAAVPRGIDVWDRRLQ